MNDVVKNWITIPKVNVDKALKWAKKSSTYITNDYAVISGRKEHYDKGDDYDNFDFFFTTDKVGVSNMNEFERLFGSKCE